MSSVYDENRFEDMYDENLDFNVFMAPQDEPDFQHETSTNKLEPDLVSSIFPLFGQPFGNMDVQ